MTYFIEVILPSVELPHKPSYNVKEACRILCCSRRTVYRMAERGEITIAANSRIYSEEFCRYFKKPTQKCTK